MTTLLVRSIEPGVLRWLGPEADMLAALYRAGAVGLLGDLSLQTLDEATVRDALERILSHGVANAAVLELRRALEGELPEAEVGRAWRRVAEALEGSPVPQTEWREAGRLFDAEELAALVGVSPASLRRYASGGRDTPQDVAERLHALAIMVGDLRGSYNDYGIRRWFQRPRQHLGGRAPRDILRNRWDPESEDARRVAELAAGSGAFVAT